MKMKPFLMLMPAAALLIAVGCGSNRTEDIAGKTKIEKAFPDSQFRAYVLENFDTDKDGYLSEEEARKVTTINTGVFWYSPDNGNTKSLKGIEYFTNLESLTCNDRNLAALDVSKNRFLTYLQCSDNNISTLDVSSNSFLMKLYCSGCNLSELDVTHNTALQTLYCESNNISELDITHNTALTWLNCSYNNISELDVTLATSLQRLECNDNNITVLDVSSTMLVYTTALHPLSCARNPLETLYLKTGWEIPDIYPYRDTNYLPASTKIVFKD